MLCTSLWSNETHVLACAHVDELDVVQVAVGDGLVHLLVLGDAVPEVLQRLLQGTPAFGRGSLVC